MHKYLLCSHTTLAPHFLSHRQWSAKGTQVFKLSQFLAALVFWAEPILAAQGVECAVPSRATAPSRQVLGNPMDTGGKRPMWPVWDFSDPSAQLKTWELPLPAQHPAWNTSGKGKQPTPYALRFVEWTLPYWLRKSSWAGGVIKATVNFHWYQGSGLLKCFLNSHSFEHKVTLISICRLIHWIKC